MSTNLIRLSLLIDELLLLLVDVICSDDDGVFMVDFLDKTSLLLLLLSPLVIISEINRLLLLFTVSSGSTVPLSIHSRRENDSVAVSSRVCAPAREEDDGDS